jgi:quinol monooxygenase YgiN
MPRIEKDNRKVTQITFIEVEPEKQPEALSLMTERARFMARQPGCISISLHRSLNGRRIVNYIQWQNATCCRRPTNLRTFASLAQVRRFDRSNRSASL